MYYISEKKNRASPLPVVQTHGCTLIDSSSCSSERRNFQPTRCMHHGETIAFILLQTCIYIYLHIFTYMYNIYYTYIEDHVSLMCDCSYFSRNDRSIDNDLFNYKHPRENICPCPWRTLLPPHWRTSN